jgi:hypothetical protein
MCFTIRGSAERVFEYEPPMESNMGLSGTILLFGIVVHARHCFLNSARQAQAVSTAVYSGEPYWPRHQPLRRQRLRQPKKL